MKEWWLVGVEGVSGLEMSWEECWLHAVLGYLSVLGREPWSVGVGEKGGKGEPSYTYCSVAHFNELG